MSLVQAPPSIESRWLHACEQLAAVGVLEWRPGRSAIQASPQARSLLGLPERGSLDLGALLACFDSTGQALLHAALLTETRQACGWKVELRLPTRVLSITGASEPGPPLRVLVVLQDISEQTAARSALEEALQRLDLATHAARIGTWQWQVGDAGPQWDGQMQTLLDAAGPPLPPARWRELVHPQDLYPLERALRVALRGPQGLDICHRLRGANGRERHLRSVAKVLRKADGRATRLVGVSWDETAQRRETRELRHRASHDPLTGLVNRDEFHQRLQRALQQGGRHALLALDLDRFKQVNDSLGHAAGDAVLCQIAALLHRHVRQRDTVARLGGDEFMVLLEHCQPDQAQAVAEQIRLAVGHSGFTYKGRALAVGVSIGLTALLDGEAADAAMVRADAACLAAKAAGRDRVRAG